MWWQCNIGLVVVLLGDVFALLVLGTGWQRAQVLHGALDLLGGLWDVFTFGAETCKAKFSSN